MKKILVLGMGKSGKAAAAWLIKQNLPVLCFDDKKIDNCLSDADAVDWRCIDYVVVSPGVPQEHILYSGAKERGISVIGEAELALRTLSQKKVAITGTNGKTTVTLLVEHILKTAGIKARSLGNIGEPLSEYALEADPEEVLVVELSSFQIETLSSRVFDAAVLLNVTPDHLDRYPDMQAYARAKCALQRAVKDSRFFFVHTSVAEEYRELLAEPFSTYGGELLPFFDGWAQHDKDNALAAWALCSGLGVEHAQFLIALKSFKKPHHRIEFVSEIDGVCYYDDSKGTNIDAVMHAVNTMSGPVILIAGGVDKGASYRPWAAKLRGKIKRILVLGQAAEKIEKQLCDAFALERVDSLKSAVLRARQMADRGDTVLLSPGCSSYDMFDNYAHRGQEFKRYVSEL